MSRECAYCSRVFLTADYLVEHMEKNHGRQ